MRTWLTCTALGLICLASQAEAQTVAAAGQSAVARPMIDLTARRPAAGQSYGPANSPGPTVQARTALDHRFAPDGVVGSVGYLCGIDGLARDGEAGGGPTSTFGHQGTFLGASLGYAFR